MFIDEGIEVEVRGRIISGRVIRRHRFILLTNHDGFVKLGVVEVEAKETEFISDLLPFGFMDEGNNCLVELGEAHEDVRLAEHTERPNHGTDDRKIAERIVKTLGMFTPVWGGSPG